jgi:hypothetical protein
MGNHVGDGPIFALGNAAQFSKTTHTSIIYAKQSAVNESYLSSGIFALSLNALQGFGFFSSPASTTISSNYVLTRVANVTPTPTDITDWVTMGGFIADDRNMAMRGIIKESWNNLTLLKGGWQQSVTELRPFISGAINSFSTSTKNIDLLAITFNAGTGYVNTPWLVSFPLETQAPLSALDASRFLFSADT